MKKMDALFRISVTALLAICMATSLAFTTSASAQTITWGKPGELLGFDPHVESNGVSWQLLFLVYETLVSTGPDLEIEPGLAASWSQDSPTRYTFKLREDAVFSNGRPVTTEDVVGSLRRVTDPELASFWAAQLGPISSITSEGDDTVVIELDSPYVPLLAALANIQAAIIPMQEFEDGSYDPTSEMLGSGPYVVAEHLQDESWTFATNPEYPAEMAPKVPELVVQIIPDDSARIAALRDGRVDIATFESPDVPALLSTIPNVETVVQSTTNYYRLDVNSLNPDSPFGDDRVRRAMQLALDRDAIAQIALAGTTEADYPLARAFPQSDVCADLPTYVGSRDDRLTEARGLIADATGGGRVSAGLIASPAVSTFPLIAQVIQANLAEAGIDVEILQLPAAEWLERSFSTGEFDFAVSWFAGYADPALVLGWWNPEFAGWNQVFLPKNEEIADLIESAKQTSAGDDRNEVFTQLCTAIDNQGGIIALTGKPDIIGYRSDQIEAIIHPAEGYFNTLKYLPDFIRVK